MCQNSKTEPELAEPAPNLRPRLRQIQWSCLQWMSLRQILRPSLPQILGPSLRQILRPSLRHNPWLRLRQISRPHQIQQPRLHQIPWPSLRQSRSLRQIPWPRNPVAKPAPKFVAAVTEPAPNTKDLDVEPAPDSMAQGCAIIRGRACAKSSDQICAKMWQGLRQNSWLS